MNAIVLPGILSRALNLIIDIGKCRLALLGPSLPL